MSKREPKCVRKANKKCRKFHKGLDDAIAVCDEMMAALEIMASKCDTTRRGVAHYEAAVMRLMSAKRSASDACLCIVEDLEGGGIEVQNGGGK